MSCRAGELLRHKLLAYMGEHGWYSVSSRARLASSRLARNPFQEIALRLVVWGGRLAEEGACGGPERYREEWCGRVYRYHGWGCGEEVDVVYSPDAGVDREFLSLLGEPRPLLVIDFSQLLDHRIDEEYLSLRSQVAAALGVLRLYLWDAHLLVTHARPGVATWLSTMLGRSRVRITMLPVGEALEAEGVRRAVLLDPYADTPLGPRDVLEAEAFIVGGIVDKVPRPRATEAISRLIPWAARRRVELKGSIIGVPNTINSIIEIVLKARYDYGGDVERAVRSVMSPADARLRAYVEISRRARGRGKVDWSFYCELASWLPITRDDFLRAARMAHVEVVGDPQECEQVSKDQSLHGAGAPR